MHIYIYTCVEMCFAKVTKDFYHLLKCPNVIVVNRYLLAKATFFGIVVTSFT